MIGVIAIRVLYLKYTLSLKKLFEQKKFLKILSIMQRLTLSHNKCLPILVSYTILKTFFSKIKIFIMNDINFDNKTKIACAYLSFDAYIILEQLIVSKVLFLFKTYITKFFY